MRRLDDTPQPDLSDRAFEVFDDYRRERSGPHMDAQDWQYVEREAMEAVVALVNHAMPTDIGLAHGPEGPWAADMEAWLSFYEPPEWWPEPARRRYEAAVAALESEEETR